MATTPRGGGSKDLSGRATKKITFFLRLPLTITFVPVQCWTRPGDGSLRPHCRLRLPLPRPIRDDVNNIINAFFRSGSSSMNLFVCK